mgnify:FL=1
MEHIIGRKREMAELKAFTESEESEMIVVYGRRRVGKTFLIRSTFQNDFAFYVTGVSPAEGGRKASLADQLKNFRMALNEYGDIDESDPANWMDAFDRLKKLLRQNNQQRRQIVFIDELPWMETPRSRFLSAFEQFWNGWATRQNNIVLVVCGSATSCIINNIINNKGGLYNRSSHELYVKPFTLKECEDYLQYRGFNYSRMDVLATYMIMGGIPHYMKQLSKSQSLAQNIDHLFFEFKSPLKREYRRLFSSVFNQADKYIEIIETLGKHIYGLTRDEICKKMGMKSGGNISQMLDNLESSCFITSFTPINSKVVSYRLTDFFTLFYLRFVKDNDMNDNAYWTHTLNTPEQNTWAGLTYELVCYMHDQQIKNALGISGILCGKKTWRGRNAQVDMVFERGDKVLQLFEIKYSTNEYCLTSEERTKIENRKQQLLEDYGRQTTTMTTIITTNGVKGALQNLVQNVMTLDDLF